MGRLDQEANSPIRVITYEDRQGLGNTNNNNNNNNNSNNNYYNNNIEIDVKRVKISEKMMMRFNQL